MAREWKGRDTVWTDSSRFDSGEVGSACLWRDGEGWKGSRYHLGTNKEVFDAEVFAIFQALKACERGQFSDRRYTIFSDSQAAILRIRTDEIGPGQQWARAAIEVCSQLVQRGNEVTVQWVPAHVGIEGNEVADRFAKEAAEGRQHSVEDRLRWEASLSHLSRVVTERSAATAQWIREHVQPERRYLPPGGTGFRRRQLQRVRKATAQRYYQLLTGHASLGSFLCDRMTGLQRLHISLYIYLAALSDSSAF